MHSPLRPVEPDLPPPATQLVARPHHVGRARAPASLMTQRRRGGLGQDNDVVSRRGADRAEQCAVRDVGGREAVGYSRGFASVVPLLMARPQLRYYQGERGMLWPSDKPRQASSILDFSGAEEQFFERGGVLLTRLSTTRG